MKRMRHPKIPDTEITVTDRAAKIHARAGWEPVEDEDTTTGSAASPTRSTSTARPAPSTAAEEN